MSEEKSINGFFEGWFQSFDKGLEKLDYDECGCLFSECANGCSEYVTNNLYRGIFNECEGDLDKFFTRLFIALSIVIFIFAVSAMVWGINSTIKALEARG